jgi:peptidoglycan/xylan/chitin deacetylase (PgdA/CDA1 family)
MTQAGTTEQTLYDYSPITERPPLRWPDGKSVAFYLGLNIEHFRIDMPATSQVPSTVGLVPDPINYGWRDYGVRVGIWRMMDLLDRLEMRASVLLNSEVCEHYPQVVAAGVERGWAWLGHGQTNSIFHTGMELEDERAFLREMHTVVSEATGTAPKGWLGPALTETFNTPSLLAELGYTYLLDWCNDDQPYPLNVPGMISVPYSVDINDITLYLGRNLSGDEYVRMVTDALDQLIEDASPDAGRVLALPVHPFIVNQPSRHRYLARALQEIRARDEVWVTTSDAIADHYLATKEAS